MSTQTRQPRGAKVAGQAAGGQFAPTTHTAPTITKTAKQVAADRVRALRDQVAALSQDLKEAYAADISHAALAMHPSVGSVVVGLGWHEDELRFIGLESSSGGELMLTAEQELTLENMVMEASFDDKTFPMEKASHAGPGWRLYAERIARIDVQKAVAQ